MKYIYLLLPFLFLTGCVVDQQTEMGANSVRTEGFSGYGVEKTRDWEGPLSDLMVPDQSPKGITDHTGQLLDEGDYISDRQDIGKVGDREERIFNNRPGVIRNQYAHSNDPHLQKKRTTNKGQTLQAITSETKELEEKVESLETVFDAHVITDGEKVVIGVESDEPDRRKLENSVKGEIEDSIDLSNVYITTNRKAINRMKALEHRVSLPRPFESIGAAVAEIVDLVDDAVHHYR